MARLCSPASVLVLLLAASGLAGPSSAAGQAHGSDTRPRLAVLDLGASGTNTSVAAALAAVVANELDRLGAFKVVTSETIRAVLALEQQKQMLGCTADASCLAEIGGALGVDYLVSGRVTALKGGSGVTSFTLDLTLSAVKKAQREGSSIEMARTEAELVGLVPRAVSRLTAKVLATRTGKLVLTSSEAGAVVKIDEQVKGTTPLGGALSLPSGFHAVMVEKQGFVAWQKDVQIAANKLLEERAGLAPSPDFIRDYESRNGKLRTFAWLSTGLAVVGVGAAAFFQVKANRLYGDATTSDTFVYYQKKLAAGTLSEGGVDFQTRANDLKSQIQSSQTLSYVSAGVGGAAAITALVLWISGEDPGRYARYREASASFAPLPGGAHASLAWKF